MPKRKDNKGKILRKGEVQRSDGSYMYRWTDRNKNRQCIYANDLVELRKQEDKIAQEKFVGITRQKTTLNEQIERYLSVKASLAVGTSENYWYYFKKDIKQDIGVRKLTELKKSDILEYYKGKSLNDDYSNGTIHILHKIIHPALQLAVDDDLIMKNPADGCMKEYPEDAQEKCALSFHEENEFLERLAQRARIKRYYPMIAIMLCSGLRISETLGLTWDDIDMDKKSISVNHQLQYRKINGIMVATHKTVSQQTEIG